jgi:hypothetical protein
MRYRCSIAIVLLAWMMMPMCASGQPFNLPIPLQKAESSVDSNGCTHLVASAVVDADIDDLFSGLSHPEELHPRFSIVFVMVPQTRESQLTNAWSVSSPFKKIIEFYGPHEFEAHHWEEYTFVRDTHTILMHAIGEQVYAKREATLSLSPAIGSSETLARYNGSECWSFASRTKSSSEKLQEAESEKRLLSTWLKIAEDDAHRIARERVIPPSAAPPATPFNPRATPLPRFLGSP